MGDGEEGKEEKEKEEREDGRCNFWLPRKRRRCALASLPRLLFCGNHLPLLQGSRVPCPIDPSHTVLEGDVESHTRKCPALKKLRVLEEQSYYVKGVNSGCDVEDICDLNRKKVQEADNIGIENVCFGNSKVHLDAQQIDDILLSQRHNAGSDVEDICDSNHNKVQKTDNIGTENVCFGSSKVHLDTQGITDILVLEMHNSSEVQGECQGGGCKDIWSSDMKRRAVMMMPNHALSELLGKIESAYRLYSQHDVEESFQQPASCSKWTNLWTKERNLPFQEKHALQQISLLGNLEAFGLIHPLDDDKPSFKREGEIPSKNTPVVVEFGAGRGYLTQMLAECYGVSNAVLVDRKSFKFKADRTLRQNSDVSFERLRIDIEDLDLKGVKSLQGNHFIATSKHLCGVATDLALRCCLRHAKLSAQPHLDGIGIATCCHHLCQWKPYVNKEIFRSWNFTEADFYALVWMTSWALTGDGDHEAAQDRNSVGSGISSNEIGALGLLTPDERLKLGLKCKYLIDIGRVIWMREEGLEAKLVAYISAEISPENKMLLARS